MVSKLKTFNIYFINVPWPLKLQSNTSGQVNTFAPKYADLTTTHCHWCQILLNNGQQDLWNELQIRWKLLENYFNLSKNLLLVWLLFCNKYVAMSIFFFLTQVLNRRVLTNIPPSIFAAADKPCQIYICGWGT